MPPLGYPTTLTLLMDVLGSGLTTTKNSAPTPSTTDAVMYPETSGSSVEMYPLPPFVIFMLVTTPEVVTIVAVAPEPCSVVKEMFDPFP